ncbi:MAG: NADH-quinone oxidoreductase subunit A [Pyrinomonadaceae bacterium]
MSDFSLMDYAPIGIMFIVALGFGLSQLLVTQLIGPRKRTAAKLMPYESGKDPVGSARDRYSIKFYSVAVIFLLFDIEVLFMVPFAVAFKFLLAEQASTGVLYGTIAFVEILVFIATLVAGYIYIWKKGTFDWGLQARAEARAEAQELARKNREIAPGVRLEPAGADVLGRSVQRS